MFANVFRQVMSFTRRVARATLNVITATTVAAAATIAIGLAICIPWQITTTPGFTIHIVIPNSL